MKIKFIIFIFILFGCTNVTKSNKSETLLVGISTKMKSKSDAKQAALDDVELQILKTIGVNTTVQAKIYTNEIVNNEEESYQLESEYSATINYNGFLKYEIVDLSFEKNNGSFVATVKARFSQKDFHDFKERIAQDILSSKYESINDLTSFFKRYSNFIKIDDNTPGIKVSKQIKNELDELFHKNYKTYKRLVKDIHIKLKPHSIFDNKLFLDINKMNLPIYINGKLINNPDYSFYPNYTNEEFVKIEVVLGYSIVDIIKDIQPIFSFNIISPLHPNNIKILISNNNECNKLVDMLKMNLQNVGYTIKKHTANLEIEVNSKIDSKKKILLSRFKVSSEIEFVIRIDGKVVQKINLPNEFVKNLIGYGADLKTAEYNSLNLIGNPYQSEFVIFFGNEVRKLIENEIKK